MIKLHYSVEHLAWVDDKGKIVGEDWEAIQIMFPDKYYREE